MILPRNDLRQARVRHVEFPSREHPPPGYLPPCRPLQPTLALRTGSPPQLAVETIRPVQLSFSVWLVRLLPLGFPPS